MNRKLDIVHIGPQKSGTTWLYECLKEHPGFQVSKADTIHYFDINYPHGEAWLESHFQGTGQGQLRIDFTPSYLRDEQTLERIGEYAPTRGVVLCLRNPLERAFSHYWHEKKKCRFDYQFEEVVRNYDLWSSWVKTGLYASKIRRCLELMGKEHVLIQFYDDLNEDPERFFAEFCEFAGADKSFKPSVLNEKINAATPQLTLKARNSRTRARQLLEQFGLLDFARHFKSLLEVIPGVGMKNAPIEKLADISPEFIIQLQELVKEDILEVQELTQRDLSKWLVR